MSGDLPEHQGVIALRPTPRYRAFTLGLNGHILHETLIEADRDEDAISIATGMMDGHAIDLWDGLRFIEHFPTFD